MVPIFLISILLADKIILYVFNTNYINGKNLFVLSLCFAMVNQFSYSYSAILYVLEKRKLFLISGLIAFLNLLGGILLIPKYGVLGAILATGFSGLILILYYHFAIQGEVQLKYPWISFCRYSINIFVAGVVVFLLNSFINSLFSLILTVVVVIIIYLLASYLNKGFEKRDRDLIDKIIGRKMWVF